MASTRIPDLSPYSIEERLVASVWVHERTRMGNNMNDIRRMFSNRFGKAAPTRVNLYLWERKAFRTGSVKDAPRSGRKHTYNQEIRYNLEESLTMSPRKSLRRRSSQLNLPMTSMRRIMSQEGYKHFKPIMVNELSDIDMVRRASACENADKAVNLRQRQSVLFTDECLFISVASHATFTSGAKVIHGNMRNCSSIHLT